MNLTEAMDIVADERFATEEVDYGHRYEASWLLTTAADLLGNANLISRMHEVALRKVHQAMQETHLSGEWWPWCETVLGCVNAWQISGDNRYLERAEEAWKHIQAHYIDTENGDWYKLVRRDGKPVGKKASVWFGPYHNGRVGLELNRRFGAPFSLKKGEVFHITSDEHLTWNQIMQAVASALGVEAKCN